MIVGFIRHRIQWGRRVLVARVATARFAKLALGYEGTNNERH